MALGSKELATDQLDGFDKERLVEELRKAKEELFNLRFQVATGQLDPDAETVLFNTGDGLKTIDAVSGTGPTATIAPSYGAFAKTGLA